MPQENVAVAQEVFCLFSWTNCALYGKKNLTLFCNFCIPHRLPRLPKALQFTFLSNFDARHFFFRICFTEEESGFKEDIPFICSHTVHIDPWFECRYIILEAQAFYLYFNCSLAPYKTHSLITSLTLQVEGVSNRKVVVIAAGFSTSDSAPGVIAGAHLPSEFCELEAGRVDLDQLHHQYFLGVMDMSRR